MKKSLILLLVTIWTLCLFSQTKTLSIEQFYLTQNGKFLTKDNKEFTIIDSLGKSQETLYNDFLVAITKLYMSPKAVIDKVENRIITIKWYSPEAFNVNTGKKALGSFVIDHYGVGLYTLQFQFKDGRVRVDAPVINAINKYYDLGTFGKKVTKLGEGNSMSEWKKTKKLFSIETPKLTGKQKKDEENIEKAKRNNRARKEKIEAANKYVNSLVKVIVDNALKSDQDSEW